MLKIGKPPYSIEIQGGEPLLRLDLIQRLYEHCDKYLKRDEFSIVIASSLSLISEEVIEWAKTRNIEFSMSLDGVANIHDKNRILATDSSHARALSGAIKIIEELGLNRLGTVTTITKEALNDPEGLINAHDNLGINSLFVRPLSPYGFARKKGMGSYSLKEYFIYYRQVLNGLKLRWEREELFTEHSMGVHVKRLLQPNFNAYADLKSPSGFALNTILFNFDGNIFGSDEARMLQRVHPEIDFSLGHVMDDTLNVSALSRAVIAGGINIDKPGCNTCAYQPFCGADPMQNISLFGEATGHKAQSPFCKYHKTMFAIAIEYLNGSQSDAQFIRDLSK
jgi:His-Xaa-Ser system radical SAM maturase HxsB